MAQALKVRDGVWRVRWRYGGTRDGAQQTVTVKTSHRDAQALKRAVEARGHRVRRTDPDVVDFSIVTGVSTTVRARQGSAGTTFGQARERYLATRTGMATSTRYRLDSIARNHLALWDERGVDTITSDEAAVWLNSLNVQPLGPFLLAQSIFRYAATKGWIKDVPTDALKKPHNGRSPARFLSDAEVDAVMRSAGSTRLRLIIRCALEGGLREGEVSVLTVHDVVERDGLNFLNIRGGATRGKTQRWTVGAGKNTSAAREVVIPAPLADDLRAYARGHGSVWLFPAPGGTAFTTPAAIGRMFSRAMDRAQGKGVVGHVRFHDMRHTHASRLLNDGVPLLNVSRRLGHASVAITGDVYGHIDPATDDSILAVLAGRAGGPRRLRAV